MRERASLGTQAREGLLTFVSTWLRGLLDERRPCKQEPRIFRLVLSGTEKERLSGAGKDGDRTGKGMQAGEPRSVGERPVECLSFLSTDFSFHNSGKTFVMRILCLSLFRDSRGAFIELIFFSLKERILPMERYFSTKKKP